MMGNQDKMVERLKVCMGIQQQQQQQFISVFPYIYMVLPIQVVRIKYYM